MLSPLSGGNISKENKVFFDGRYFTNSHFAVDVAEIDVRRLKIPKNYQTLVNSGIKFLKQPYGDIVTDNLELPDVAAFFKDLAAKDAKIVEYDRRMGVCVSNSGDGEEWICEFDFDGEIGKKYIRDEYLKLCRDIGCALAWLHSKNFWVGLYGDKVVVIVMPYLLK